MHQLHAYCFKSFNSCELSLQLLRSFGKKVKSLVVTPLCATAAALILACSGGGNSPPPPAPPPSISSFSAGPGSITRGGSASLSGTFSNGTGVVNPGGIPLSSGIALSVSPDVTTRYTLTVTGSGGSATSQTTVAVVEPPAITAFAASPAAISPGGSTVLSFAFSGGAGSLNNGVGPVTSGTNVLVSPTASSAYTLTVANSLGAEVSATVTVVVVPMPAIASFTASSTQFFPNQGTTLTAIFSNGTGIVNPGRRTITSGVGLRLTPGATTRYILSVTNSAGAVATSDLVVRPGAAIAGGPTHSLALKEDGTVWAWGGNARSQLGNGSVGDSSTPMPVIGLSGVQTIAGGEGHSLALREDGTVWAWGANTDGQIGDGTRTSRPFPSRVSGLTEVVGIAGGTRHSLALKVDGTVWAWGSNSSGEFGDGTTLSQSIPVQVKTLTGVLELVAGPRHTLTLKSDGTVWASGSNNFGQLGDGSFVDRKAPVRVEGLTDVVGIAAGDYHSLALRSDGTVWGWGFNYSGQLGDGSYDHTHSIPVRVSGLGGVQSVAAGRSHSFALLADGTLWAWGNGWRGALGDGTESTRRTPVQVLGLSDVLSVVAGESNGLALRTDGRVFAWEATASANWGTEASSSGPRLPCSRCRKSATFPGVPTTR